jgi:hypothetical protein
MSANPWKLTSALLAVALGASLLERLPEAEAAGPVRLGKALAALRSGKKDPPQRSSPRAPKSVKIDPSAARTREDHVRQEQDRSAP